MTHSRGPRRNQRSQRVANMIDPIEKLIQNHTMLGFGQAIAAASSLLPTNGPIPNNKKNKEDTYEIWDLNKPKAAKLIGAAFQQKLALQSDTPSPDPSHLVANNSPLAQIHTPPTPCVPHSPPSSPLVPRNPSTTNGTKRENNTHKTSGE